MATATVRISDSAHAALRELASKQGKPMLVLLDEAVEALRLRNFLDEVNAGYAALRADPTAWEAVAEERRVWDRTLADGLERQ